MAARMSPETATLLSTYLLGLQQGGMEMLCFFGAFIGSFNSTIVYSVLQDIYDDQTQSALVQGIAASVQAPVPSITAGHVLRATWTPTDMVKGALWGLPTGPCADCGAAGPCFRCLHANATMAFAINTAPGSVTVFSGIRSRSPAAPTAAHPQRHTAHPGLPPSPAAVCAGVVAG